MARFRNCIVVFNNYPKDFDYKVFEAKCSYYIIAKEVGPSGTPHLQCYLEFKNQTRIKSIQKMFKSKVHVEKRYEKSTAVQASEYCKKDGNFVEYGTISRPGKRSDITKLRQAVKDQKNVYELYDEHDAMWKYNRAAKDFKYHMDMKDNKFTPMKVYCFYGPAGSGKTRLAHEMDPNLFFVPQCSPLWMDGYTGQKTILFDDFYGTMDYSTCLKMIDGYRFSVPRKGGFEWKKWTTVIFTSNVHPSEWYLGKNFEALGRRFTEIKKVGLVLPQPLRQGEMAGNTSETFSKTSES
ncbi:MAG: putative viral replication protein [Cressdnaviricota sp.]|nr:MAG: putative viral replication protein [Cressdnaviricota sp.]